MGAISQAQVQLLVTARSEAQAVMNQTATSVKTVTDAVAKNTELMGGAEKQQRLLEEAVERSRQAQESWARQVRIAAGEIAGLTDTDKQAIQNAKELAISNETVAATLGISTAAVKAYRASLRTKNDTEEESKRKSSGSSVRRCLRCKGRKQINCRSYLGLSSSSIDSRRSFGMQGTTSTLSPLNAGRIPKDIQLRNSALPRWILMAGKSKATAGGFWILLRLTCTQRAGVLETPSEPTWKRPAPRHRSCSN